MLPRSLPRTPSVSESLRTSSTIENPGFFRRIWLWLLSNQTVIALGSLFWLAWRSGTQPRRIGYPCQQAAAANVSALVLGLVPSAVIERYHRRHGAADGRNGRFARRALVLGRTLFAASLVFLVCWGGAKAYNFAAEAMAVKVSAAIPPTLPSPTSEQGEVLSPRLLAPSANEAIVAYRRDATPGKWSAPNYRYSITSPYDEAVNPAYGLVWQTVADLHLGPPENPLRDLVAPGDKVVIKLNIVKADPVTFVPPAFARPIVDMCAIAGAAEITLADAHGESVDSYSYMDTAGYTDNGDTSFLGGLRLRWPGITIRRMNMHDRSNWRWVTLGTGAGGASAYVGSGYSATDLYRYWAYPSQRPLYFGTSSTPRVDSIGVPNTGNVLGWWAMSNWILGSDVVINVGKMKVHWHSVNTICMKNWVGTTLHCTYTSDMQWDHRVSHYVNYASNYQKIFGDDVLWRDLGDLMRATLYWKDGTMHSTPVRKYLAICDAIACGETSLHSPTPYVLGAVLASVDPVALDAVGSRLMGYDWRPKNIGGEWKGGIPVINNQQYVSAGYPLGTSTATKIRVVGDLITSAVNHVFDFDSTFNPSRTWADWDATKMTDFSPPSMGLIALASNASATIVRASATGASAAFATYGDDGNGAPYAVKLAQRPGSDIWEGTLPAGVTSATVTAQDDNLNGSTGTSGQKADFDQDGDVDLSDFGFFQTCFNGPNRPTPFTSCVLSDFDGDDDVDLSDFSVLLSCFNGPNRPPACP